MDHKLNQIVLIGAKEVLETARLLEPESTSSEKLVQLNTVLLMQVITNQMELDNKLDKIIREGVPTRNYRPSIGGPS